MRRSLAAPALAALAALASGAVGAPAAADARASDADARGQIVAGAAGGTRITLLACANGAQVAGLDLPSPLAAAPVLDASRGSVIAVTRDRTLLRLSWPDFSPRARAALGFAPTAVAVAPGADGIVLAGGAGPQPVSAHAPDTLETLHRYPIPTVPAVPAAESASVSSILVNPARRRFVVGFADLPQAWEVAWNRDAPPVLLGFVHDYRNGEAVPLPGRLSPRPFRVASGTHSLLPGAAPYEIARIDADGRFGVLNLDVRREIEHPPVGAPADPQVFSPWRTPASRGWAGAGRGQAALIIVDAAGWRIARQVPLPGEVLASAPARGTAAGASVLVAHRAADGSLTVSRVDIDGDSVTPIARAAEGRPPVRFLAADDGCTALLDADGRWLAGVPPAAALSR